MQTLMEGSTGSVVLQTGDRYAVHSGAAVKFGNIGCTIHYSAQPRVRGTHPLSNSPEAPVSMDELHLLHMLPVLCMYIIVACTVSIQHSQPGYICWSGLHTMSLIRY